MAQIFLSYAREDADAARQLAEAIGRAGHEVWWDQHIQGGSRFSRAIDQALKDAEAVVVLWSETSVEFSLGPGRSSGGQGQRPPGAGASRRMQAAARLPPVPVRGPDALEGRRRRGDHVPARRNRDDRAIGRARSRRRRLRRPSCAGKPVLDLRAAVRQHERRPRAGIFQRRDHRGHHHRSVEGVGAAGDRAQHGLHLQGQGDGREGGRARARCQPRPRRQRAQGGRRGCGSRPS